jgi:alkaline phosphatase
MTEKAIQILSRDPDGFFLMVEGGQIDWASHDNHAFHAIQDTIDLDQAVNIGRSYADENAETLMIVTADHETGGMDAHLIATGLPGEDGPFLSLDGTPFYISWSTSGHTSADVPISARGPNAELISAIHQNTTVFWLMSRLIFEPLFLPFIQKQETSQ